MRRFLLKLFRRRKLHEEMEAELAFHRDMAQAEGNPIGLGNTTLVKENALDLWRFTTIENWWRDLLYAARGLKRSPGFLASALLSLGLGIGVNTAVFSLAVEFLLSEPSVRDPRSMISIQMGSNSHARPAAVEFLRDSKVFEDVAGENEETFINWNDGHETRRLFSVAATKNYFDVLGTPMLHGRAWSRNDPDNVVVLRHQFWRKYFHEDPGAIGKPMMLDGRVYTITGVLPEKHRTLIGFGFSPDVYLPYFQKHTILSIHARMKPGMTPNEATAALKVLGERMDSIFREPFQYAQGIRVVPMAGIDRLEREREMLTIGLFFLMLLLVVGLVLLIACMNVASLLLARAQVRQREIAVRLSLGASRGRLLQQLMVESLLLSLGGAVLGTVLAQIVARGVAAIQLPLPLPIRLQVELDWRVMSYAALLIGCTTVACGLLPAWQSVRRSMVSQLAREKKLFLRRALVGFQICVSVVVLATGFLFVRNLMQSGAISPGFDVLNTLRAEVFLPPEAYSSPERKRLYFSAALRELDAIPGIEAAAAARIVPFTDSTRQGAELLLDSGEKKHANFHWNAVTSRYFEAMGIPLLAGRTFAATGEGGSKKVIVNEPFVKAYLAGNSPVGLRFQWGDRKDLFEILGVVPNTKNLTIGEEPKPHLFQPLEQIDNDRTRLQFVMRSSVPPGAQVEAVRSALRRVEPGAAVEVSTMYSSIGLAFLPSQIGAALLGSVGLLGLLLAAIGLYGVCAYSVAQRTREIGLRMAIGATKVQISRMVLVESGKLIIGGTAVGIFIALFVTKPLAMFFVSGLSPADPASYAAVLAVFLVVGGVASLGPALRAMAVDPASSLRYE